MIQDPLGQTIRQEWCSCGKLAKLVDANGNATTWDFDDQDRLILETRPDNSYMQYVYENTTSRLKRRADARGQHTDYVYYTDDALQQASYPNAIESTATVTFTYDTSYRRIATMTDGIGTTAYTYHPVTAGVTLGATSVSSIDGPLANDTITYTYDELGRLLSRSIDGVSASNSYDALGRVDTVTNVLGSFTYGYVDQTLRLATVIYPNGQTSAYSYYPNSGDRRLQQIHHQTSGAATISKFDYVYDPVGNITTWMQQRDGGASAVVRAYDFGYDARDQLVSALYRTMDAIPTVLGRYVYTYDPAGNRTAEQIDDEVRQAGYDFVNRLTSQGPGGSLCFSGTLNEAATVTIAGKATTVAADNTFSGKATVPGGTSNIDVVARDYAGNQRTSTYQVTQSASVRTFSHDANGNMTSDGARTFEWDAENRLLAVEAGTRRSEFTYDGFGRRVRIIEKNSGATTTDYWFLWCGFEICEERDSTGATTTKRFFTQGEQQGSTAYFYTLDHLGSVRELTDGAQSVSARYDYDPYGRRTNVSGVGDTARGYTGHFHHAVSGLALAPFRAYDSDFGRWINPDPIGLAGGLNLYGYTGNRPVIFGDELGLLAPVPGVAAVLGATVGLVALDIALLGYNIGQGYKLAQAYGYFLPQNSSSKTTANSSPGRYPSPRLNDVSDRAKQKCENNGCKPCVPPVGTISYRLDTTGRPHRGVAPPHWHLYVMNQSPAPMCRCFWVDIADNRGGFGGGTPPTGTIPIQLPRGGGVR